MDYVAEAATLEEEVMPWDMEEVLLEALRRS